MRIVEGVLPIYWFIREQIVGTNRKIWNNITLIISYLDLIIRNRGKAKSEFTRAITTNSEAWLLTTACHECQKESMPSFKTMHYFSHPWTLFTRAHTDTYIRIHVSKLLIRILTKSFSLRLSPLERIFLETYLPGMLVEVCRFFQ